MRHAFLHLPIGLSSLLSSGRLVKSARPALAHNILAIRTMQQARLRGFSAVGGISPVL